MKKFKVGGQFSGVGAFDEALKRLECQFENVYQAEWDKFARMTYLQNHTEPEYYVQDVYDTPTKEITNKHGSIDIMMFSPPCQAFSLAGNRKGEEDKRGVLFYNSHEFIKTNKPRFFIFENVKGLLSDDSGKTFGRWVDYLGGKSINGIPNLFPHEESVPYHIYYKVLNAKDFGIPQNRERIFIIGIRDDADNNFNFPKPFELKKRLKDVLEENVDEKYYLSEKMVNGFIGLNPNGVARTIRCGGGSSKDDKHNWDLLKVGYINQDTQASQVIHEDSVSQTLCAGTHGYANGYVQIGAIRGRNNSENKIEQTLEVNKSGLCNSLTTVQKDNVVVESKAELIKVGSLYESDADAGRVYSTDGISCTLKAQGGGGGAKTGLYEVENYRIRKLTPIECFRLMDFPDSLVENARKVNMSDSQLYKQAGNSIAVGVLERILKPIVNILNEKN